MPLKRHLHENSLMYFNGSKQFNANITVGVDQKAGNDKNNGTMHLASKPSPSSKKWPKTYTADVTLSASSAVVLPGSVVGNSEKSKAVESYPSHNMLPVMIYIGKASSSGSEGGDGGEGGDSSKYTKIFSNNNVWSVNVVNLTREIIDYVVGGNE